MLLSSHMYLSLPELIRYTGAQPPSPPELNYDGYPWTAEGAILAGFIAAGHAGRGHPGRPDYEARDAFTVAGGLRAPEGLVRRTLGSVFTGLCERATSLSLEALAASGRSPEASDMHITVRLHSPDVFLCPLVDYDEFAARGKLHATPGSVRLVLHWFAKSPQLFEDGLRDIRATLRVPKDVVPVLRALGAEYALPFTDTIAYAYASYATAVRTGEQPRPDHVPADHPNLILGEVGKTTLTTQRERARTEADRSYMQRRRLERRQEQGERRELPAKLQAEYDREVGHMYGIPIAFPRDTGENK